MRNSTRSESCTKRRARSKLCCAKSGKQPQVSNGLGSALGRLAEVSTKFDAYWERQRRVAEVASRVESLSALLHKAELLAKRDAGEGGRSGRRTG